MNIDIHLHTNESDGDFSVAEIIEKARGLDIKLLSIVDHDRVSGYEKLKEVDLTGITVIPGVELSSVYDSEPRDILGYGIDISKMDKILKNNESHERDMKRETILLERYIKAFRDNGIEVDEGLKVVTGEKNEAYEVVIFNAETIPSNLEKYPGLVNHSAFFWDNTAKKDSPFYVDSTIFDIGIKEAVEMIHKADGLAFFAHPCIHHMSFEKVEEMLDEARSYGIDGIEILHAKHSPEARKFLNDYADRYSLLKSGGSDFHGSPKPDIKMLTGRGDLKVEYEMVAPWVEGIRKFGD